MITPSKLNPIKFFAQDEPVYWDTNEYGADRGRYYKNVLRGTPYKCYFDSSELITEAVLLPCNESASVFSFPAILVSGTTYAINIDYPGQTNKNHYLAIYTGVAENIIPRGTVTGYLSTVDGLRGGMFIAPITCRIVNITVKVNIVVLQTQLTDYFIYEYNADGAIINTYPLTIDLTGLSTGIQDINITVPYNVIYFTKGARLGWAIKPRGLDAFYIGYNKAGTNYADSGWATVDGLPTFEESTAELWGFDSVVSEQVNFRQELYYRNQLSEFRYKNVKAFAGIPANTEIVNYLPINFWQTKVNQEYEDIEIYPGQFTRLRNETVKATNMETDYLPPYTHEYISMMLGLDQVTINGIEQIQRESYVYEYTNRHFQLTKGRTVLTEKKSIYRNVI